MKKLRTLIILFLLVGCMASEGFFNGLFKDYGMPVVNYNHVLEMKEKESSFQGEGTSYLVIDDEELKNEYVELLMDSTNLVGYHQQTNFYGSQDRDYHGLIQYEEPLIDLRDELDVFNLLEVTNDEDVMLMIFNETSSKFGLIWIHRANKLTE